jgi:hypothetical protein
MKFYLILTLASLLCFTCQQTHCLTIEESNSKPLQGYVLTDQNGTVVGNSGVRIGLLDLQFETEQSLKDDYGLNSTVIAKVVPYAGLTGDKAVQALAQKPLMFDQQEFDDVNQKVTAFWMDKLESAPPFVRKTETVS